jgi:2-deoxy-D-gluconate 3-dehydrogenase
MLELSMQNRVCIVTGAAMGIGASCAELLHQAGARLVLVDIRNMELQAFQDQIDPGKESSLVVVGDTANPETAKWAVSAALNTWGRLDCLVNNAAINIREKALEIQSESWERIIAVNLTGYFNFARESAIIMQHQGHGSIVNISSELSFVGSRSGQLAYSTTKGGINQMTRTLAAEWAEYGIRVNAVAPGLTETPLVAQRLMDAEYRSACTEEVPLKRLGQPADIAHAVVYLSSSWAGFITGQVLVVDGGYTAVR